MTKQRILLLLGVGAGVLPILLLAGFLTFVFYPLSTTFNVTAHTERLLFRTGAAADVTFDLDAVSVFDGTNGEEHVFSGQFQVASHTDVVIERIAFGPLRLILEASRGSTGTFFESDEPVGKASSYIEFSVPDPAARAEDGRTLLVPIAGEVVPGRDVGAGGGGTTSILRSGTVTMLGRSILSNWFSTTAGLFEAGTVELEAGDQFHAKGAETESYGFAVVDERPGLTAAYRVQGRRGIVSRPGPSASGYSISVSLMDRILNDRLFQAVSLASAGILAVVTLFTSVLHWIRFRRMSRLLVKVTEASSGKAESQSSESASSNSDQEKSPRLLPARFDRKSGKTGAVVLAIILSLGVVLSPEISRAQEAIHVKSVQDGQGLLRARGEDCMAITPAHVVPEDKAKAATITGAVARRAEARPFKYREPDLALLQLEGDGSLNCDQWLPIENLDGILENAQYGFLKLRNYDGTTRFIKVTLGKRDEEYITFKPADGTNSDDEIRQTMSGAPLIVSNATVGILMRLSEDDPQAGLALQLDNIMRILEPDFPDAIRSAPAPQMDLATSQFILDRARKSRDGSMQGQGEALKFLLDQGHTFVSSDFVGIALAETNIAGGTFSGAQFDGANLQGIEAAKANFQEADFRFAETAGAGFQGANLKRSYAPFVDGSTEEKRTNFEDADLNEANFRGADLRNANFRNASLRGTALAFADVRRANFDGADLTGAYLTGAVLDGATFVNATFENTGFLGASISDVSLTERQRKGACRHENMHVISRGDLPWRIDLMERWPSTRYSTGYEYEVLVRSRKILKGFGDRSLPLCMTAPDRPPDYHAKYLGEHTIGLDRSLIAVAGRRGNYRKRVDAQAQFLERTLSHTRTLRGDNVQVSRWEKTMQEAAKKTRPISAPYLNTDLLLVFLLREGLIDEQQVRWESLARTRHEFEHAVRSERGGNFEDYSMWPPLYPPDAPWGELPVAQRVERYRTWTLNRIEKAPRAHIIARGQAYLPRESNGETVQMWVGPGKTLEGSHGTTSWPGGLHRRVEEMSIDLSRTTFAPVLSRLLGISRILFVFPDAAQKYRIQVPQETTAQVAREHLETALHLDIEEIDLVDNHNAVLIFATPTKVQLIDRGKTIWEGPPVSISDEK